MKKNKTTLTSLLKLISQSVFQPVVVKKSCIGNLSFVLAIVIMMLGGIVRGNSQVTVTLDSSKNWIGYMNWFANNSGSMGGYIGGGAWGTADLRAFFDAGTNYLTLTPNTNVYDPTNPYWVNPDGSAAKWMDANFYVEDNTLAGQTVTFDGRCLSNNLVSPYTSTAFIKDFDSSYNLIGSATSNLVGGQNFSITLATVAGGHIQYGFETMGPDANPTNLANLGFAAVAVSNAVLSVSPPASLAMVEGQNAQFIVTAQGAAPISYQWSYANDNTTNVLADGGRILGATSNSLTISNLVASDAGTYIVAVTNQDGSATASAGLVVVPLALAQTNLLIDPGFESDTFASSGNLGWFNFSGAAFLNTNDYYFFSPTPVSAVEGTNVLEVFASGSFSGVYQDRPALPGQVYTANGWFLTPSADPITDSNTCYLEIQFRDAGGNVLRDYQSGMVDTNFPTDTWVNLQPTNVYSGDFTTSLGTSSYLVAPAGTASVRAQITYHNLGGFGEVTADALTLKLRSPVATVSRSSSQVQLSFPTLYGPTYSVMYKTNITDASWQVLTSITGDGTVKTVTDDIGASNRFYTIDTQ